MEVSTLHGSHGADAAMHTGPRIIFEAVSTERGCPAGEGDSPHHMVAYKPIPQALTGYQMHSTAQALEAQRIKDALLMPV
jgi:hypothetical protein